MKIDITTHPGLVELLTSGIEMASKLSGATEAVILLAQANSWMIAAQAFANIQTYIAFPI